MFRFLASAVQKIRRRSDAEKKALALGIAGLATGIIAVAWAATLPGKLPSSGIAAEREQAALVSFSEPPRSAETTPSFLRTMRREFVGMKDVMVGQVRALGELGAAIEYERAGEESEGETGERMGEE